jgi:hypothetical protein
MTIALNSKLRKCAVGAAPLLLAAISGIASADADSWYGIDQNVGNSMLYVNPASITREGDTRGAWLLKDFRDPQPTSDGTRQFQSIKELVAVRCADNSYARKQVIQYSGSHAGGGAVGGYTLPPAGQHYEKALPLTQSQAVVDSICNAAP